MGIVTDCCDQGLTPLHLATFDYHTRVMEVLLDCEANPNIADVTGKTPLHFACYNGHEESVQILLDHQASRRAYVSLFPSGLWAVFCVFLLLLLLTKGTGASERGGREGDDAVPLRGLQWQPGDPVYASGARRAHRLARQGPSFFFSRFLAGYSF
jgi:ankyrin repeat protein